MAATDDNDAYLSNDTAGASPYAGDVIDLDTSTIPLFGSAQSAYTGITQEDWSTVLASAGDLFGNMAVFVFDPLNWLITAGLGFLIDFFQPLEDLLSLVTGNAERIVPYADTWRRLGAALVPLGEATKQAATDHLIDWKGQDAEAATARLVEFSEAIKATGQEAASISALLVLFSKIMSAAQQIIISILATLVEWFIVTWIPAMGAAGPTMGGSVAAAGAASGVEAAVATTRAVRIIDKVMMLLQQLGRLLAKVLPESLAAKVGASIVDVGTKATFDTAVKIAGKAIRDPVTYVGPGTGVVFGRWKYENTDAPAMSDEQIDEALDVSE